MPSFTKNWIFKNKQQRRFEDELKKRDQKLEDKERTETIATHTHLDHVGRKGFLGLTHSMPSFVRHARNLLYAKWVRGPKHLRLWAGVFVGSVAAAMTCPSVAHSGPLSIGVRAMDYVPTDGNGSWKGGAQARLQLPLFFAVEGSVDYRRDTFGPTTANDYPVQLSALLYPLPKILWVQPFLLAGGGWYHTTVKGPDGFSGTQNRFGPHVGAGVEFNLNSSWFLDGTYRYVWLNDLNTVNAQGAAESVRDRGHMITFSLNYRL